MSGEPKFASATAESGGGHLDADAIRLGVEQGIRRIADAARRQYALGRPLDLDELSRHLRGTELLPEAGMQLDRAPQIPVPVEPASVEVMNTIARLTADGEAMRAKLLADLECTDWVRISVAAQDVGRGVECVRVHCLVQESKSPELRDFPVRRVGKKQKMLEVGRAKFKLFMTAYMEADKARKCRDLEARRQKNAASKHGRA